METTSAQILTSTAASETEGAIPLIREYIGIKPGYRGGKPHILGHRIKVEHNAVMHERMGMSPAQIVADLPTINLAKVHAPLTYYYSHHDQIEADIREGDAFVEQLRAGQPSILERAREKDARNDPISSG